MMTALELPAGMWTWHGQWVSAWAQRGSSGELVSLTMLISIPPEGCIQQDVVVPLARDLDATMAGYVDGGVAPRSVSASGRARLIRAGVLSPAPRAR
jgi:hypothetical protein